MHPRRGASPDDGHVQLVRRGRTLRGPSGPLRDPGLGRMVRDDPLRESPGRARRPINLRPAVPLDQVRIKRVEGTEQPRGFLDEPAKEHHTRREIRGDNGRGPGGQKVPLHRVATCFPAGRGDDEPADTGR